MTHVCRQVCRCVFEPLAVPWAVASLPLAMLQANLPAALLEAQSAIIARTLYGK
jgi:hypothetical protein